MIIGLSQALSQNYNFTKLTNKNGLISNQTTSVVQDKKGYLWIGTKEGLSRFDGNNFLNFDTFSGLSQNSITDIIVDDSNQIFVIHPDDKVTKITTELEFSILEKLPKLDVKESDDQMRCEVINKSKIKIYHNDNATPLLITGQNGLKQNEVNDAFVDRENTLWIASKENGLMSLPLQNFPLYPWNNGNLLFSYKQSENSYLLTFKNNIVSTNLSNGKPYYSLVFTNNARDINCAITQFGTELFYGTTNGMYLYFRESGTEYSFDGLAGKNVTSIEKIGNGDLLIIADKRAFIYSAYSESIYLAKGLESFEATSIIKLDSKILLLGKGNIYQVKGKSLSPFFETEIETDKLNFTYISTSNSGKMWVSTSNNGLYLYDKENVSLFNFSKNKSIPYTSVLSCIQEGNNLWISTKVGVIWYNIDKNIYSFFGDKYFNKSQFLPFAMKYKKDVYFVSEKGLVKTFDSQLFQNSIASIDITEILVSGKAVTNDSIIETRHNGFPIKFTYQSISLKNKIYYQYYLSGKDDGWSNPRQKNTISYEQLTPGNYTFMVRTYDPINELVLKETQVKFRVLRPFWKTPFFLYLMIGLIGLLTFAIVIYRSWRLKKTTAKLEKMVDEKTFILTAQNQNIEQFSFSLSHDLKNPINNIKGLVEILEDADEDSRPEITKMLMNSAILLEDKIKATLETIRQMQANKKNVEQLYFDTIFEETKKSLLILINENDVKFITDFKEKSFYYNQSILDSIFYNLVSNSIKYGSDERQKIVKITSEKIENDSIQLVFEDNGIGFDLEKDREKVFSIFERVHDQATGTGIGLYMVKQMIELNGGTIMVHSKINEGTVFKIILRKMR
ncbi:MAG: ATP-binding protein [Flavobacteriales bacterium]|nr:ATP-binding protein [Flavobacteriales bacterium]MDC1352742.1 ATP-binding protein [Flavobacteriales bacterium]